MTDWKIGDKVFYFWHEDSCSLIWDLKDLVIKEDVITNVNVYGIPAFTDGYAFFPNQPFFKSQEDAKNAMIKYLQD